jgi:NitT/TauT family transport system ATP-binding protein
VSGGRGKAVEVKGVRCIFQHTSGQIVEALCGIDLEIPAGQLACIVGRSGGGKSTLVRAIAGLTPLTEGTILVDGTEVSGPSSQKGMVFQEDTVFPWMRVQANVEFGLRAQGMARTKRRQVAAEWLSAVRLQNFAESWPRELSGGMRKRVALAAVFAAGADLLLMDEPFGALDYVTRLSLHEVLLGLWRHTGRTIIFVTHDIEEALVLGDRILLIGDGRLIDDLQVGLPRPRSEEVRASPRAVRLTKTIVHHLGLGHEDTLAASPLRQVGS